jgi:hypothetical protein
MMNKTEQRFEAARAAMQGILSNSAMDVHNLLGSSHVAIWAIEYADALLAELARTEPTTEKSQLAPDADGWVVRIPTDPIPEKHNGVRFGDGQEDLEANFGWSDKRWNHTDRLTPMHITHYRPA